MGDEEDGILETPFACNHIFHEECLEENFSYIVEKSSLSSHKIKCPFNLCNIMIHESKIKYFLSKNYLLKEKYEEYCFRAFVSEQQSVKWCPSPGCKYAIELIGALIRDVKCRCGQTTCFGCNNEAHSPCDCELSKKWKLKMDNESESMNWIIANSKECPKCKNYIERNTGCNCMTCKCGHKFCYMCYADWSTHGSSTGGW